MHIVYILKVAAEIFFVFNRVARCSPATFTTVYWTLMARPNLVDIIDIAARILRASAYALAIRLCD